MAQPAGPVSALAGIYTDAGYCFEKNNTDTAGRMAAVFRRVLPGAAGNTTRPRCAQAARLWPLAIAVDQLFQLFGFFGADPFLAAQESCDKLGQ